MKIKSWPIAFVILLVLAAHAMIILLEAHPPSTDVFLFKEAGVNLALHGQFVAANLPHLPPDVPSVFAYYPPLYPLFFGIWSKLTGVGLKQSMSFDAALRILRTLLLLLWSGALLTVRRKPVTWMAFGLMALLTFISSDGDRPDELALVFGLLSWTSLLKNRARVSGLFLGLSASTSPAAGVFFGLGTLAYALRRFERKTLVAAGVAAVTSFLVCNLPIQLWDPKALARFSKQVPLSTFPWAHLGGGSLQGAWGSFCKIFLEMAGLASPYFLCVGILALLSLMRFYRRKATDSLREFHWAALFFIPLSAAVWTLQPYYLWFSAVILAGLVIVDAVSQQSLVRLFLVAIAFLPLSLREAKNVANAWQRPPSESSAQIRKEILNRINSDEKLAVTADQYFTFRSAKEIANVHYVCNQLEDYAYVYITRQISARRGDNSALSIPCEAKRHCFQPAQDFTSQKVFSVLGLETPYYVRGNGGILYANVACRALNPTAVAATLPK